MVVGWTICAAGRHGGTTTISTRHPVDEPTTNGYDENVINKVKVIKRRAYGVPDMAAHRRRLGRATRSQPASVTRHRRGNHVRRSNAECDAV
jgi:hypothetical protein